MATKEDRNFMTVRLALDKPCTHLLQDVLRQHVPEKDMHKLLNDPAKKRTIISFVRKLNQETRLYPQTGVFNGSYADFDLSLLYVLIRNLTGIPDHTTGWGNAPDSMDNSTAANIERIRLLRNKYAHGSTSHLTDKELKKERKNIISCIHGIEKRLLVKSTKFEDAAEEIFDAAKKQENLGENITKCQGITFFLVIFQEIDYTINNPPSPMLGCFVCFICLFGFLGIFINVCALTMSIITSCLKYGDQLMFAKVKS